MTQEEMAQHLDVVWRRPSKKVNWLELEADLVDILKQNWSAEEQINMIREAIDAHTRRGHFIKEQ